MREFNIPFSGFYESLYSSEIDSVLEQEADSLVESHDLTAEQASDIVMKFYDNKKCELAICKSYVSAFEDYIKDATGLTIPLTFAAMTSPREYNFTTDRIFASMSNANARKLYAHAGKDAVSESVKKQFSPRSGFVSFYSDDIVDWGPFAKWDYNQLMCILDALASQDDFDLTMFDRLYESVSTAAFNAIDWRRVDSEIAYLKDIEIGDAVENNGREFPASCLPLPEYAKSFCELNHLIN